MAAFQLASTFFVAPEQSKPNEAWGVLEMRLTVLPDFLELLASLLLDLSDGAASWERVQVQSVKGDDVTDLEVVLGYKEEVSFNRGMSSSE